MNLEIVSISAKSTRWSFGVFNNKLFYTNILRRMSFVYDMRMHIAYINIKTLNGFKEHLQAIYKFIHSVYKIISNARLCIK